MHDLRPLVPQVMCRSVRRIPQDPGGPAEGDRSGLLGLQVKCGIQQAGQKQVPGDREEDGSAREQNKGE